MSDNKKQQEELSKEETMNNILEDGKYSAVFTISGKVESDEDGGTEVSFESAGDVREVVKTLCYTMVQTLVEQCHTSPAHAIRMIVDATFDAQEQHSASMVGGSGIEDILAMLMGGTEEEE